LLILRIVIIDHVYIILIHVVLIILFVFVCSQEKYMSEQFIGEIIDGTTIPGGWNVGIA
jgi:hypothetical protein